MYIWISIKKGPCHGYRTNCGAQTLNTSREERCGSLRTLFGVHLTYVQFPYFRDLSNSVILKQALNVPTTNRKFLL